MDFRMNGAQPQHLHLHPGASVPSSGKWTQLPQACLWGGGACPSQQERSHLANPQGTAASGPEASAHSTSRPHTLAHGQARWVCAGWVL